MSTEGEDVKLVKNFEYVKGVKASGVASPGTEVSFFTKVTTNQGRTFVYGKKFESPGRFEFILPYPTEEDTLAAKESRVTATPYRIRIGDKEREINISEEDVIKGSSLIIL